MMEKGKGKVGPGVLCYVKAAAHPNVNGIIVDVVKENYMVTEGNLPKRFPGRFWVCKSRTPILCDHYVGGLLIRKMVQTLFTLPESFLVPINDSGLEVGSLDQAPVRDEERIRTQMQARLRQAQEVGE